MKKPIKEYPLEEMYNYHDVITYIEKKYNIKTRGYANSHSQFDEWCDSRGYSKKMMKIHSGILSTKKRLRKV